MFDELADWDAIETAARIARGEVSREEVIEAAVARARASDSTVAAITTETFDAARAQARAPGAGRFAGVPTFIKDIEDVAGVRSTFGSAALSYVAKRTSPSVAQFLSTGVISLGKSTTSEFGLSATTEPVHARSTRNPHDPTRSSGGSSGGAGALVAAGVVPIAHGSDGGGSIRIPAAFCGLVGLKATRGRLANMASAKRTPVSISTYGVLTRSLRDTAAFLAAVDGAGAVPDLPPIGLVEGPGRDRLRIGVFIDSPFGHAIDAEIGAAVEATARDLEGMGHLVEPMRSPYTESLPDDFLLHWGFIAAAVHVAVHLKGRGGSSMLEPWTRGLAGLLKRSWWRLPVAIHRLRRFEHDYASRLSGWDAILSPVTASPAPQLGYLSPALDFETKLDRIQRLFPYTPVQNASGAPAISLPVTRSRSGLPLAVQLAAPHGHERRLLELAVGLIGPDAVLRAEAGSGRASAPR